MKTTWISWSCAALLVTGLLGCKPVIDSDGNETSEDDDTESTSTSSGEDDDGSTGQTTGDATE